ncbi:methyltransferase family protein [Algoriphagus ratkowskyi]|uniref:Class I SAM-dependent methyltransferase n=1 Tax=Algoriphagus ratkowskyi TaxID=57028 RepID=A0A2W7RIY5_9BACT|nr:class I SAM-dependent methyltransferase [Algoriphagus ratkowskyi]PZX60364.1 methyltransferase family protein [Algoriphagus ratkowskyi]TXD78180.1 class I SAM-dependent methyltransferase [Algoriphagus ratkowskyi]
MATYTTEIASDKLVSDNPIHQRLLKAYIAAQPWISGKLLEVGCGEGRGVETLLPLADSYLGLDKIQEVIDELKVKYPKVEFQQAVIPPFKGIADNSFDTIVSFQVIEHIPNDSLFLKEIYRVLKPGGKAVISTPNINHTLSRNPWHEREYTPQQLIDLCSSIFDSVEAKGVGGNDKVWAYHEANRKSVQKIMRFDIFDLQYKLPASILRMPYEILNRRNRNKLHQQQGNSVVDISHVDYPLVDDPTKGLDLFYILRKK